MQIIQVIRLSLRLSRKSISYCVYYTFYMLNFKVKHLNPCNLLSNKSSQEVCSSTIKLGNKNFSICFQNKVDSIQLVLKSLKALKDSLTFSFYSIIVVFCLVLNSRFILGHLLFVITCVILTYNSSLSFKTYIYSNINLTLSQSILDFTQSQCYSKHCLKSIYYLFLFNSLVPPNILPKEQIDRHSNNGKIFNLDLVVHINSNKCPTLFYIPIRWLLKNLNDF